MKSMNSQVLLRGIQIKLNNFAVKLSTSPPCGVEQTATQPPLPHEVEVIVSVAARNLAKIK